MNFNLKKYVEENSYGRIEIIFQDFPDNILPYSINSQSPDGKIFLTLDRRTFSSASPKIGQALINLCKKNYQLAQLSQKIIKDFINQPKAVPRKKNRLLAKTYQPSAYAQLNKKATKKDLEINSSPSSGLNLLKTAIDELVTEAEASEDMKEIILEALLGQDE